MIAASNSNRQFAKLLAVDPDGQMQHLRRAALGSLFGPADLVIANDTATLPASLAGVHCPSDCPIEVRLAAWVAARDPTQFTAIAFGAGNHRTRTEDRSSPPRFSPGDRLCLGRLTGFVECTFDHPRLFRLRLLGSRTAVLAGIARHGRPIQYAHVPQQVALWDVWTSIAACPIAIEAPSAGFALDWHTQLTWCNRGVGFVTVTHAAGISTTGDPALDERLPFDEPYYIPEQTALAVKRAKSAGGRVIAVGTSVVRALESAAHTDGTVCPGAGVARGRIGSGTPIYVANAILTGVHQPGESHYELLRAFADEKQLNAISTACEAHGYRAHEFGDSVLLERPSRTAGTTMGGATREGAASLRRGSGVTEKGLTDLGKCKDDSSRHYASGITA